MSSLQHIKSVWPNQARRSFSVIPRSYTDATESQSARLQEWQFPRFWCVEHNIVLVAEFNSKIQDDKPWLQGFNWFVWCKQSCNVSVQLSCSTAVGRSVLTQCTKHWVQNRPLWNPHGNRQNPGSNSVGCFFNRWAEVCDMYVKMVMGGSHFLWTQPIPYCFKAYGELR